MWFSVISLAVALGMLGPHRAQARSETQWKAQEDGIQARVAEFRRDRHLIALQRRPELDRVARTHARDMARRNYLAHVSPEGNGPVERLHAQGVTGFTLAAENIGKTSESDPGAAVVRGWLASPQHRDNLMAPPFNATGIGVVRDSDGMFYIAQVYTTYPRH
ncbi:CAP domain-containing protein [Myxococcota bacterium]|nr:CAP domain-containing protein [Myxococcota bacterium]